MDLMRSMPPVLLRASPYTRASPPDAGMTPVKQLMVVVCINIGRVDIHWSVNRRRHVRAVRNVFLWDRDTAGTTFMQLRVVRVCMGKSFYSSASWA